MSFNGNSFIDIFVGKNGTGKSNFFEALIEIFRHLYEFDKKGFELYFDYNLTLEIDGQETTLNFKSGALKINGRKRKTIGKTKLPDNVLIYYSGHNRKVAQLIKEYEESFSSRIKKAGFSDSRRFIGIGPDYKELLLSILLMQEEGNAAREYIKSKLGIVSIADEVKLILKRPDYAHGSSFEMTDGNSETERYWKPEGITKDFLNRLIKCISTSSGEHVRTEGYLSEDEQYILYFDIEKIQVEFNDYTSQDLFRQFDNLKTLGMLQDISIAIKLHGDIEASIAYFSDGQFQSVYIYAITELFKESNCITLLDEPDSFLHPEWQFEFLKQIFEITDTAAKTNHVLMSSHSAVTLISHDSQKVNFFDIKDNSTCCYTLPKKVAIQKMSSNLIKYSEQDNLLSIINTIQIENKPVFFTEGSTDPIIIKEAWYKLYEEEIPFIPFYAFSCTYINQLITDQRIHNEMNGLPIFALFDFDKAYDQWNGLNGDVIEDNPLKGMIKKWAHGESYALMLPVPDNIVIRGQVIKDTTTNETFGGNSKCEIEHLFYGQTATATYFSEEQCMGGSEITFKSDGDKTKFAKEVVPNLSDDCFEVFRPMFEFVKLKCKEAVN